MYIIDYNCIYIIYILYLFLQLYYNIITIILHYYYNLLHCVYIVIIVLLQCYYYVIIEVNKHKQTPYNPHTNPNQIQMTVIESSRIGCSKGFHRSVTLAVMLAGYLVHSGRSVRLWCPTLRQCPEWDPYTVSGLDLLWSIFGFFLISF